MFRLIEKFIKDETILPKAILFILGLVLLGVGCYAVGPWYVGGPTTAMGAILEADLARAIPSAFYIVSGLFAVIGVVRKRQPMRYWGAFMCSLSFSFLLVLRLLTFGFIPIIWVFILAMVLISAIIFLWESGRDEK